MKEKICADCGYILEAHGNPPACSRFIRLKKRWQFARLFICPFSKIFGRHPRRAMVPLGKGVIPSEDLAEGYYCPTCGVEFWYEGDIIVYERRRFGK